MSRLALEFGISGNGLAKICDRLNVPYPPRGYWARKEAGQKVVTFRLPECGESTPAEVTISPTPPPIELAPAQQEAVAVAKLKTVGIEVPSELKKPHPVIAGWLSDHKEQRRRDRPDRNPHRTALPEWTDGDRRQHRILDTIFRVVEKQGLIVKSEHRGTFHFEYKTEKIHCRLREKSKQVRRPKTADELRWSLSGEKSWTQVLEPTGNLVFTIDDYLGSEFGIRREWLETQTKRIEDMVPELVASVLLAGPALVTTRQEREEQKRQYKEAERRRQLEATKRRKAHNQWRALTEQADRHAVVEKVRQLIGALEQKQFDPATVIGERPLAEWLAWVKERLAAIDPVERGIAEVFEEISKITESTYRE